MIKGLWKNSRFFCMNHEKPVPMIIRETQSAFSLSGNAAFRSMFYACPKYMLKDAEHEDGHEPGEPGCGNRISIARAEEILDEIGRMIEEDMAEDYFPDYRNTKFTYKGVVVTILRANKEAGFDIGILNKEALH